MTDAGDLGMAAELAGLSVSMLADATGGHGVLAPGLSRYAGAGTVAGRAITADCAEGSLQAVFAALEHAGQGDILCIRGPGNTAYLGDLLAANLIGRGLAGAIVDGFVRDRAAIAPLALTIHARGLFPANLRRPEPGKAMGRITLCGISVAPGDWVVADDDGVIVIAPDQVREIMAKAQANARVEARIRQLIGEGVSVAEAVKCAVGEAGAR